MSTSTPSPRSRRAHTVSGTKNPGPKVLQSSSPKKQYLILYNFASALSWLVVLGRVVLLVPMVGFGRVYPGVGYYAKWTQTVALLEVVHAATGIVRAPISTTAMQVASRILLVWGIVNPFPSLAKSAAYSSMLLAWSITEVIRYSFFTFNLSGYSPGFISWLRYNMFFVLYPLGISSECWLIYKAIEPAREIRVEYAWVLQFYSGGLCSRVVYPVYTYDGSEEESYEGETGREDTVDGRFWHAGLV
ncbi:putative very-long-chain (3R)-3-hydroxyacyl-CoA dehydratase [Lachnellula subtilissima]|uniref:Very-long-chain (3R)-3-hydroxyacyl-CoA dehydratase n=1 Tax=Lachnellula subtilissima TaxID=602034 RepID=A0A8H8RI53_9HELO|nr:putative very-long-chain (3R)-3-hydroxyacyl-CoA dehydratase [Lachnellula subtilissima]